jgi:hypothetical protein
MQVAQRQIDSIRARTKDGAQFAKVGGLIVGGIAALETWTRVRDAIQQFFK